MAIINGSNFNDNNTVNGFPPAFRPALIGTNGHDTIRGFGGNDIIFGLAGNDWIDGGFGLDQMNGGAGFDTLDVRFFNGDYHLNMTTGVTNFAGETAVNFERVFTGNGNDIITGTSGNDHIYTGGGNDRVYGGLGNDLISGQDGNDILYGQAGKDRIFGGNGNDFISGGYDDDYQNGGAGIDTIDYTHWNSGGTYNLNTGLASFVGFYTEEIIDFENINTGAGADSIFGTSDRNVIRSGDGNDIMNAGDGNDWVSAGGGDDIVNAGAGNDTVYGSTGNDTLNGGTGNDVLVGGTGNDSLLSGSTADRDIFRYNSSSDGYDRILDFDTAGALQDIIQVRNVGFNPTGGAVDLFNGGLPANRLVGGGANLGVRAGFRYFQGSGNLYFDSNGGSFAGSQLVTNINGAAGGMAPPSLAQLHGNIEVI